MAGLHFRRQHPIDRFIVDFCCVERCLVIEVDGEIHVSQSEYDTVRTEAITALGYRVLRWTNERIQQDLDGVLDELRHALQQEHN